MKPSLTKQEWRWLIGWALLIMLITSLPYLYGLSLSTPDRQFGGFILGVEDGHSYLAKMRMGATGGWLFHLPYTPEPHDGAYLFTFYLALGKVSHLFDVSPVLVYHLARVVFGVGLLLTLYYFIASFVEDFLLRRFAFLIAALGSGLGWLLILFGLTPTLGLPLDFYLPEGFIFLVLLNLPHLALAESLLFIAMLLTLFGWQTNLWSPILWAGLVLLLMALMASFYLTVYVVVFGGVWVIKLVIHRSLSRSLRPMLQIITPVLIASPLVFYQAYVFLTNPIFQIWAQQNIILSPPIWHYVFAYGLLIIPAVYGSRLLLTHSLPNQPAQPSVKILFLIVWCLVFPILVYLPFNLQRRLVVGVQVPLAILAAVGLSTLYKNYLRRQEHRLAHIGTLIIFSLTNLFILVGGFVTLFGRPTPIFQATVEIEAMQWLNQETHRDREVILALYDSGNLLPAYADVRPFVGHGPETVNSDEKRAQADRFFDGQTNDTWRLDLLRRFDVTYVYYGPKEQTNGAFDPHQVDYLEKIYDEAGVQIFKVLLPPQK